MEVLIIVVEPSLEILDIKGLAADYLHSRIVTLYLRDATEYLKIPQISPQFTRFITTSYPVAPPYIEGGALPDELVAQIYKEQNLKFQNFFLFIFEQFVNLGDVFIYVFLQFVNAAEFIVFRNNLVFF